MQELGVDGEVIVADNGSTDGSQEIARHLGARVIDVPVKGYGSALLGRDRGRALRVRRHGRRRRQLRPRRARPVPRRAARRRRPRDGEPVPRRHRARRDAEAEPVPREPGAHEAGPLLFRSPSGDFHCGMRAFRRSSILSLGLRTAGMEFASEMVVRATLGESPDRRGPGHAVARRPHTRAAPPAVARRVAAPPVPAAVQPAVAVPLSRHRARCSRAPRSGIALLPGPLHIGSVGLDVNALVYCAVAVIIGFQAVTFSVFARAFAASEGLLPPNKEHGADLPRRDARGRAGSRAAPLSGRPRPLHLHDLVLERAVVRRARARRPRSASSCPPPRS